MADRSTTEAVQVASDPTSLTHAGWAKAAQDLFTYENHAARLELQLRSDDAVCTLVISDQHGRETELEWGYGEQLGDALAIVVAHQSRLHLDDLGSFLADLQEQFPGAVQFMDR